ncbi:hypothetical protein AWB80_03587 [Caballeronia pedi]|uniref:Uncharacterized protein n=1 Tax=Caballeronia pedi TaxID=1777141 RepID=A0A158BHS9_9BURK|nr:hypothetical protein [Caballeronia pedi]SAK69625.1 hypothetical protein AWB80_03587 [Caballeronia pedi]
MNAKKLARAVFFDVLLAICLYLWIVRGADLARDVAIAYLCVMAEIMWIAAVLVPAKYYEHGCPVNAFYDFVSSMAIIGILAWHDERMVAMMLLIPYLLTLAKREMAAAW